MKKEYIVPTSAVLKAYGRRGILEEVSPNYGASSINTDSLYGEANQRTESPTLDIAGTSDNGVTTGGFGSDSGPWESLW